ncbi:MAG: hypothetical protein U1U88_001499 [Lawsonella clevelandensis]
MDDYAAYGVSFWGVLTGNCGSVSAFWTRQTSDEIIEATENTPLASVVAKVLPPKSTSMKEIGEAAYLKGAKNKGVVGWTTSTGVGISFLGVNPATATYVGRHSPITTLHTAHLRGGVGLQAQTLPGSLHRLLSIGAAEDRGMQRQQIQLMYPATLLPPLRQRRHRVVSVVNIAREGLPKHFQERQIRLHGLPAQPDQLVFPDHPIRNVLRQRLAHSISFSPGPQHIPTPQIPWIRHRPPHQPRLRGIPVACLQPLTHLLHHSRISPAQRTIPQCRRQTGRSGQSAENYPSCAPPRRHLQWLTAP